MNSHNFNAWRLLLPLMMLWLLMGCSSGKSFDVPQSGEIPKGPGLFTKGDDGAVLYDSKGGGLIDPKKEKAPKKAASSTGQPPEPGTAQVDEFEDFEAYKQWQEWKKGAEGTDEYKDFKDWQKWKQYQEWKQRQ